MHGVSVSMLSVLHVAFTMRYYSYFRRYVTLSRNYHGYEQELSSAVVFNEMVRTEFNILQIQSCRVQPGSVKPAKDSTNQGWFVECGAFGPLPVFTKNSIYPASSDQSCSTFLCPDMKS